MESKGTDLLCWECHVRMYDKMERDMQGATRAQKLKTGDKQGGDKNNISQQQLKDDGMCAFSKRIFDRPLSQRQSSASLGAASGLLVPTMGASKEP